MENTYQYLFYIFNFFSPQITNFFDSLPLAIENEMQEHLSVIIMRIASFKQRGADLTSGKLKNEMCEWWLGHIEKRVDGFLSYFFLLFNYYHDYVIAIIIY